MYRATSYELAEARGGDLSRQAQRAALAHDGRTPAVAEAAAHRNRIRPARLPRIGPRRRFGKQLWTLLNAQALLDGPATGTGLIEDDYRVLGP